jgi:hypothetical protein
VSRRAAALGLAAAVVGLALGGCGQAEGVAETRTALERSGFGAVDVSLRSSGGIDVARVDAAPAAATPAERAAEVVWATLPVRFDQLVVTIGDRTALFGYEALAARFGPRDPSLDRRQISEEVVEDGLRLMLVLLVAGLLSVSVVVAGLSLVRGAGRAGRERPAQAGGASWAPDDTSPTAGEAGDSEGPEAIPS